MSQVSQDASAFFGIVSDAFDGRATLAQAGQRLDALGGAIQAQAAKDVADVEALLGPKATAAINAGIAGLQPILATGLQLADDDIAPYLAAGAKAAEGAVDTVFDAAFPEAAALNPALNAWMDAQAASLKAGIDAQTAAWKAKLAANPVPAAAAPVGDELKPVVEPSGL
jgi:hypothetical protein